MDFKRARNDNQVELRRQEILDACKKLFLEKGYEDTTLLAVSKLTSVGRTTIYNYYPTKEDMFMALCTRECLDLVDKINELYDNASGKPEDDFCKMIEVLLKDYKAIFNYHMLYISQAVNNSTDDTKHIFIENATEPFKKAFKKWLLRVNDSLTNEEITLHTYSLFVFFSGIHTIAKKEKLYNKVCESFAKGMTKAVKK